MDISKCNQFLATASKDGKIIVWDWQKGIKIDEITAHNGTVNNIKFFSLKIKNSKDSKKE
jgi:WD40 repeat protein